MAAEAQTCALGMYALGNLPNRRNTPNSAATPNKPPILPKLSTNYTVIITNKPNFLDTQMNVSNVKAVDYENKTLSGSGKNKPKQTQFQRQKMLFGD